MKLKKEKTVSCIFFGKGASSEGDFHAGLNVAAVLKVRALFFCRNNGCAISTPVAAEFHSEGVAPTMRVDGNDFFAVYDAVAKAREHCLRDVVAVTLPDVGILKKQQFRPGEIARKDGPLYDVEVERAPDDSGDVKTLPSPPKKEASKKQAAGVLAAPIINDPEAASLGVAKIQNEAVVTKDKVAARPRLNRSWSFDQRVVDGEAAAKMSRDMIALLENPARLL